MRNQIDRLNSCDGKTPFGALAEASDAAKQLNGKHSGKKKLHSYKCQFCCKYHIGHENKNTGKPPKIKRFKKKLNPNEFTINYPAINEGYCIIKLAV